MRAEAPRCPPGWTETVQQLQVMSIAPRIVFLLMPTPARSQSGLRSPEQSGIPSLTALASPPVPGNGVGSRAPCLVSCGGNGASCNIGLAYFPSAFLVLLPAVNQ